jgi:hypothetical protein
VALMRPTVEETKREFEQLERAVIDFNYFPFDHLAKPLMEGTFTIQQALDQCAALKNEKARGPNTDLVSAFHRYSSNKDVAWFNSYPKDFFPIAADVVIPVNPAGFWADKGVLKVLWVQKWKGRTLDALQKAIFHTVLDRRVFVGDDFGSAEFEWVDLKAPKSRAAREIEVLSRKDFAILTDAELKRHTDVLLEALRQHTAEKRERKVQEKGSREPAPLPLFDLHFK